MSELYTMITTIVDNPKLYLGRPSIQRLYAYIGGYLHQNNNANDQCLCGFNEYIAAYYKINSDHNWADIIQFFANSGQEEIDLFKKHFESFSKGQTNYNSGDV